MLSIFLYAANAILPLIALILLGFFLQRSGNYPAAFFSVGNRFVFRVCLPVLLFYNIYNIEELSDLRMDVVWYCLACVVVLFTLSLLFVRSFVPEAKQKGVILQCAYRSNYAIIGIPLAQALGGDPAVATASLLSAFTIPVYNILAVVSLSIFVNGDSKGRQDYLGILKGIAQNPLIRGVLLGVFALVLRQVLPTDTAGQPLFTIKDRLPFVYSALKMIAAIASPFSLVVLGGQFNFAAVPDLKRQITMGCLWRLLAAPLIGLAPAILLTRLGVFSFGMTEFPAMIALFGTPVAVSSAIMAEEMKNDGQLAAQLVVWTSVLSMFSIFFIVVAIRVLI